MRANCTSRSAGGLMTAPASTRTWGWSPGTGIGTAIAGDGTPRKRFMRSTAEAVMAPVLPALTIASASPSRTARAQPMIEESRCLRTALTGSSSMAMTSRRVAELDPGGERVGQQRVELLDPPDQHDAHVEVGRGAKAAGDDLARRAVAPHRVDRDRGRAARPSAQSTSMRRLPR